MIFIKSKIKYKLLLIIGVLLIAQFVPSFPELLYSAATPTIELEVNPITSPSVGDTVQLLIKRKEQDVTESVISLSRNAVFTMTNIKKNPLDKVNLTIDPNQLIIEWAHEEASTILVDILIEDEGIVDIIASNRMAEEFFEMVPIHIAVEPVVKEVEITEEDEVEDVLNKKEVDATKQEEEEEVEDELIPERALEREDATLDGGNEDSIEEGQDEVQEEIAEELMEKELEVTEEVGSPEEKEMAVETQAVEEFRHVSSWREFIVALEDAKVKKIYIEQSFERSGSLSNINMKGDKIIEGNEKKIDFRSSYILMGDYNLSVKDLVINADFWNTTNSSVFYSDKSGVVLSLKDVSFQGVTRGQVAKIENGHINVGGTSHFETSGPFEVFEANSITFEENSNFTGITTGTGVSKKEVINLYNFPTILIEENASVRLETKGRDSIINVKDGSKATINVLEGGKLLVYSDNDSSLTGKPLINLPNAGSKIQLAQSATLDIQNYRDGDNLGALLSMEGKLLMQDSVSKVAFWDKGANTNNPFGDRYTFFTEVINGELTLLEKHILAVHAVEGTSLSESDNPVKAGETFKNTFTERSTSDIKRLLISPSVKKTTLDLHVPETMAFETTTIGYKEVVIPRVDSDWLIRVEDTRGRGATWEVRAQAEAPLATRQGHQLDEDALIYREDSVDYSLKEAVLIRDGQTGDSAVTTIKWTADEGIFIKVNPMATEIQTEEEYSTNIIWTLQDAP